MMSQITKAGMRMFPWMILLLMATSAGGCSGRDQTTLETHPFLAPKKVSEQVRRGEVLYASQCAVCHGLQGRGDGPNAARLERSPRDFTAAELMAAKTDDELYQVIAGGGKSVGLSPLMPPWGKTLNAEEVRDLIQVLREFSQSRSPDGSHQAGGIRGEGNSSR